MEMSRRPWHRRPKEPNTWYDRFVTYYLTTPATRRTVDAAYRQSSAKASRAKQASGAWYRNSQRWQWAERAEAYDADQRDSLLRAIEEERLEDRRRRIDVMKAVRTRLVQALRELDPTEAGWSQVVHGAVAVNAELRKEYSDEPEARSPDSTTPTGRATAADLDDLTDDQLEAIEKAARIMAGHRD